MNNAPGKRTMAAEQVAAMETEAEPVDGGGGGSSAHSGAGGSSASTMETAARAQVAAAQAMAVQAQTQAMAWAGRPCVTASAVMAMQAPADASEEQMRLKRMQQEAAWKKAKKAAVQKQHALLKMSTPAWVHHQMERAAETYVEETVAPWTEMPHVERMTLLLQLMEAIQKQCAVAGQAAQARGRTSAQASEGSSRDTSRSRDASSERGEQ